MELVVNPCSVSEFGNDTHSYTVVLLQWTVCPQRRWCLAVTVTSHLQMIMVLLHNAFVASC